MLLIKDFNDLVNRINSDLNKKGFCRTFQYKRKELAGLKKAGKLSRLFVEPEKNGEKRVWSINEGGGTELQYHIDWEEDDSAIYYGLGFNAQHVPFKNEAPLSYIKPFIDAFFKIEGEVWNTLQGYDYIYGSSDELKDMKPQGYVLIGKYISLIKAEKGFNIDDIEYKTMLDDLINCQFEVYEKIYKAKNNPKNSASMPVITNQYITFLLQKHQVILTGAPGTGKTYLAREVIAKDIIGKGNENLQIAFVQFHPSYDYTDFVEGLRPVQRVDNKEIGFELKNGAFKEFCRVAGVVERAFAGKKDAPLTNVRLGELLGGNDDAVDFWKKYENNFQKWSDALKQWRDNPKEVAYPYEALNDLPKFVFIIDEVNRAEISKVFGELMFSIDEGYRGIAGKVKTQYANIQTNATFFSDKANDYFFVPSNVYILGTMNDIDRSVETFDFAMRRRFAWREITVGETQKRILDNLPDETKKEAISKMNAINTLIMGKDIGLNESYCIGASYFGKLKSDNSFDNLWAYHLEPLLREYLRGLPDAENKLKTLKTAYDNAKS